MEAAALINTPLQRGATGPAEIKPFQRFRGLEAAPSWKLLKQFQDRPRRNTPLKRGVNESEVLPEPQGVKWSAAFTPLQRCAFLVQYENLKPQELRALMRRKRRAPWPAVE